MGKPRFRYTLRTMFVVATVGCACLYHWHVASQLRVAEAELRKLRTETGRITLEDRSKLHAIYIDTGEPNVWRWRLFIPKGHRFGWNAASQAIPLGEPPAKAGITSISNEPYWDRDNEVLVTARLQTTDDGTVLSVESKIGDSKHQMSGVKLRIPQEHLDWMKESSSLQREVLGSKGTTMVEPDKPVILLSKRPMKQLPDGGIDFDEEPSPGLMIWLSPR